MWRAAARPFAVGLALVLCAGTAAAQDATPPTVQGAAVNGATLTVTFDATLEPAKDSPQETTLILAFSVPCDTGDAHPNEVSVNGRVVTLGLNSPVVPGAKVVLDYVPGFTDDPLRAADDQIGGFSGQSGDARPRGGKVKQFLGQPVTNETPTRRTMGGAAGFARVDGLAVTNGMLARPTLRGTAGFARADGLAVANGMLAMANGMPAGPALRGTVGFTNADGKGSTCPFKPSTDSGAPVIVGVARVGETLTASTTEIEDPDGLSGATFAYQWVSSDGSLDTDIAGATGVTYTLIEADEGRTIWVRVTFTDDAGNEETRTSAATEAVAVAAELESAATEERGRGLILTFTKDIAIAGLHTHYTVSVDGARRATRGAFWEDNTVGLVLAEPVRWGQTVTVAYAKPSSGFVLHDADELAIASFGPVAVANTVPRAENRPATGAPVIEGAAQVGGTLTASTAAIADADGLAGANYTFQWVSNSGGGDADIAGATGASLTLTEALLGRTVNVRVTFTDDAGYRETLVSAATAAVAPRLAPLTAAFHDVPAKHDGKRLFRFELRFSENFPGRFDYRVLRDRAFVVTNGQVREAKRIVRGRNDRWTIAVRPASWEDVTITLPSTTDCAAPGAICTPDGRKLANAATATVLGPAALSVADAEATEGADAAVEFRVTLGRAALGTVTVDYVTRDGTAKAGEDYTRTRGTLTFAPGEREKTVAVPILDDALDEGSETFTLKLLNARGAAIADGEAVGTITNADPLQKMWLSRFGRTVAGHVTEAVSDRLATPLSGAQVTLGGQRVDLAQAEDGAALTQALTGLARALGASQATVPEDDGGPGAASGGAAPPVLSGSTARTLSGRELLLGSAFQFAREGEGGGPGLAAWGRVTVGGFDGEAPAETGNVRIDGEVTTGILGADAAWNQLLAGVAVSVSEGAGSFDQPGVDSGTVESTMTAVSPYARFMVNDRVSVWGLAGWGTGDMTIVQAANDRGQPERVTRADLEMRLAALGGRGVLMEAAETGAMDLALKADAFVVETESEPVSNEGATTADASRLRLVLEGSRSFEMGDGAVLTPVVELGLRHDGGDAETGTGVELGGRVSYADPGTGLSVEARARMLLAHADSGYEEWGASAAVRLDPGARGRGLSFSVAPTWGAASSGTQRLWSAQRPADLAPGGAFEAARGLHGELGYGLPVFGERFTGTPNVGFGLSDGAREVRIGWRLTPAARGHSAFEVNLDATRREAANGAAPEHAVMLRGALRW